MVIESLLMSENTIMRDRTPRLPVDRKSAIRRGAPRTVISAAVLALSVAACNTDRILDVKDPDVALPGQLSGKATLETQLAGAIGDFQVSLDGTGNGAEGLINFGALFTDEFFFTESFPTRIVIDQRNIARDNSTLLGTFFNAERARASAERVSDQYNQFDPGTAGHAEALNLGGYSVIMLAETYCSGVPLTRLEDSGELTLLAPLTTAELLTSAVAKFDSALQMAIAVSDADQEGLARLGKARALVDLGRSNLAEAAAVVQPVPDGFEYNIFHSTNSTRQWNGVWELMWNEGRWSQSDSEGGNGLPFRSAGDARTPFESLGRGFSPGTQLFGTLKYSARDSNVVLASGIEARLIEAEADLEASNVPGWLTTLNDLRSAFTAAQTDTSVRLEPLSDPGTDQARLDLMFHERAFWMYATGHRLGDLRRLARSVDGGGYGLPAESVFPTGTYVFAGNPQGTYGTDVNFPIPVQEDNNSESQGCIDRLP